MLKVCLARSRNWQDLEIFLVLCEIEGAYLSVEFISSHAKMWERRIPTTPLFMLAVFRISIQISGMPPLITKVRLKALTILFLGVISVAGHGDILGECTLFQKLAKVRTLVHGRLRFDQWLWSVFFSAILMRIFEGSGHTSLESAKSYFWFIQLWLRPIWWMNTNIRWLRLRKMWASKLFWEFRSLLGIFILLLVQ